VRVAEEITGVDDLRGLVERRVVDEDRPEHTLLRLEVVRQGAVSHDYAGTTFDLQLSYKFSPNFSTYFIYSTFVPGDGIKDQLATTADDTPAQVASLGLVWTY